MARFDNRSSNQPINMLLTPELSTVGGAITSFTFDTSAYDAGYTIIFITKSLGGSTTMNFEILTSNSVGSGFTIVPEDKLIGGAIPEINSSFRANDGQVAISRGVIGSKRFVRARIFNISSASNVFAAITLNGAREVAPPTAAEGAAIFV